MPQISLSSDSPVYTWYLITDFLENIPGKYWLSEANLLLKSLGKEHTRGIIPTLMSLPYYALLSPQCPLTYHRLPPSQAPSPASTCLDQSPEKWNKHTTCHQHTVRSSVFTSSQALSLISFCQCSHALACNVFSLLCQQNGVNAKIFSKSFVSLIGKPRMPLFFTILFFLVFHLFIGGLALFFSLSSKILAFLYNSGTKKIKTIFRAFLL